MTDPPHGAALLRALRPDRRTSEKQPAMNAYIDESARKGPNGLWYLMCAAVVVDGDDQRARDTITKLLLPRQDHLHWRNESDARRDTIVAALSDTGIAALVVVRYPIQARRAEKGRVEVLTNLASDLASEGVDNMVIEARDQALNRKDHQTLIDARHAGLIPDTMSWTHQPKRSDPLLWAADAIAGVVGSHFAGVESRWYVALRTELLRVRNLP